MSEFHIRLQKAMDKASIKQSELCEKTGIGKSSISQYLSGDYEPKQQNIYKLAKALNVSPSHLMGLDEKLNEWDEKYNKDGKLAKEVKEQSNSLPILTPKDEDEIAKDLEAMLNSLDNQNGMAAFNDPEDEEDRELLKASLLTSMRLAKQIAKKKFTPKKHRKE